MPDEPLLPRAGPEPVFRVASNDSRFGFSAGEITNSDQGQHPQANQNRTPVPVVRGSNDHSKTGEEESSDDSDDSSSDDDDNDNNRHRSIDYGENSDDDNNRHHSIDNGENLEIDYDNGGGNSLMGKTTKAIYCMMAWPIYSRNWWSITFRRRSGCSSSATFWW